MMKKSMRKEIEKVLSNRKNWDKLITIEGCDERLIYISAKNELRREHHQNGYTVAILIGFFVGTTLATVSGEWE